MKKKILSGMRPTGKLHLGHLIGTLDNWVKLQEEYDCFFMVADWHALMSEYEDPAHMGDTIIDNVADWLACGISPKKAALFIQSQVPAHLELYMFLSLFTPLGWLERCPTYKEQLREIKNRDLKTYAFLGYPVLQAADILLYKSDIVPVGEDQLPHLELTREIARKFNSMYKKEVFPQPQALLNTVSKLRGLDGRKMSKSYNNYINLSEEPEEVRKKIKDMFTDPLRIRLNDPGHPDKCNVHSYYAVLAPLREPEIDTLCRKAQIGCTECKKELAEILISYLAPIQKKRKDLLQDKGYIRDILREGKEKAYAAALETIVSVRKLLQVQYEL
ncbi:MAG: tryptophan--tRNA ligase [Candidatus Omnitrophota bacterium]|jgi:tryptophanyl-tRNA synthetase|nr:MAG: tryptophan--tRNA ligase [Candidatus Omnitrophota bacterium]